MTISSGLKNNPIDKTITTAFQGVISYDKIPHTRGMTQFGLAAHMGIGLRTLKDYGAKSEFSPIYDRVMTIIKSWNAELALTGEINQALVARLDGHIEKTRHHHQRRINQQACYRYEQTNR